MNLSESKIIELLKQHKFTYKKPHAVPARLNQQAQEEFVKVLCRLKEEGNPLYFLDATHPEHQSNTNYSNAKKSAYIWCFIMYHE